MQQLNLSGDPSVANASKTGAKGSGVVQVLVPLWLPKTLDYKWHENTPAQLGQIVQVEVARKTVAGLVVGMSEKSDHKRLKSAEPWPNTQIVPEQMQKFYRWAARYTLSVPGSAWRAALIGGEVPEQPAAPRRLFVTGKIPPRMTEPRQKVLDAITQQPSSMGDVLEATGVSHSVVNGLVKAGALEWRDVAAEAVQYQPELPPLNDEQQRATDAILAGCNTFQVSLLDGVTGSGKTEVYWHAIADILKQDSTAQIVVLVPEIGLTPQLATRFAQRFGTAATVWHSGLTPVQRKRAWWQIASGQARVVIGARSALFLPYQNIRAIIIDEEHDNSYKQDELWRYHGRDMAIALGSQWQCPVVLGSATPSLETYMQATVAGKYQYLQLKERHGAAELPTIRAVDLTHEPPLYRDDYLSPPLIAELEATLNKGQQSLLFLNRRGVAPVLVCGACGTKVECPHCSANLIVHAHQLKCHHCNYSMSKPMECSTCHSDRLRSFGPGTRRIAAEVEARFPNARIAVMDSDALTSAGQIAEQIEEIRAGKVDIIIGTQMVTKGHDFPNLALVGIVDADMALGRAELRAGEQCFQMLTQVAGRAGRRNQRGMVIVQTYQPENPLIQAIIHLDKEAFYALELKHRKQWGDPPFSRLIALQVQGKNERDVKAAAQKLATEFASVNQQEAGLLGPAAANMARVNNVYRWRLIVQSKDPAHALVQQWLQSTALPNSIDVFIDVDPQALL